MQENDKLKRAVNMLDLSNPETVDMFVYVNAKFEDLYERLEKAFISNNLSTGHLPSIDEE